MKKLFALVLLAVLAACGSLEQSQEELDEVSSQNLVMCPIPCCGNSVTFHLPGCNGTIFPAGNSVPTNTNIVVRFYNAQNPGNFRLSLVSSSGVAVNCSWVWANNTAATCTPPGAGIYVWSGLAQGTTYTTTVQRWTSTVMRGGGTFGYWKTIGTATFTTSYPTNSQ